MKAIFSLLLTVLLITGIAGCDNCNLKRYVDINVMYLTTMHAGWQGREGRVNDTFPVAYDSVIIKASFSGTFYGNNIKNKSHGFLSTALASEDCDDGKYGSKETIKNITVISLTDFDNDLKANDTLNSIVEASKFFSNGQSTSSFKILSQYIAEIQPGITTDTYHSAGLYLKLNKKPTQKIIRLRVDIEFTNGEKYSAETIPITIKQ